MTLKFATALAVMLIVTAEPAYALGLGDLAKIVLGNGATVQKAADTCANKVMLAPEETLALTIARQAAQSALPSAQFLTLDTAANSQAVTQSQAPGFCNKTAKRKNVLIDAVKKAGQKLITARVLGL
jgi:hypothetical protein